jgi:hypothetical protein
MIKDLEEASLWHQEPIMHTFLILMAQLPNLAIWKNSAVHLPVAPS